MYQSLIASNLPEGIARSLGTSIWKGYSVQDYQDFLDQVSLRLVLAFVLQLLDR